MKAKLLLIRNQLKMGHRLSFAEAMLLQRVIDAFVYQAGNSPAIPGAEQRIADAVELLKKAAPAMLADNSGPNGPLAGRMKYPVIPEGYVMVPVDLLSELRDLAHPEIEKYCEMWEGRRDREFPALRKIIADADALLAAAPQPQNEPQNIPEIIPNELIAAVNRLLDSDGSRGCYSAIKCYDAHIEVERLLAAAPQEVKR